MMTICDLGYACEMANYGEYSGDPNTKETYHYTSTILDLTRSKHPQGRCSSSAGLLPTSLMAKTFKGGHGPGEYQQKLQVWGRIYVRRGRVPTMSRA